MDAGDIVNLLELGLCAGLGYLPIVAVTGYVAQSSFLQQKVQSLDHLEEIICEEAILLGIGHERFCATFPADFNGFRFEGDHYHICIQEGMMGTRAIVRNQLYLISKGVAGRAQTVREGLHHLAVLKPKAIMYGAFRLKL